MTGIAGPTRGPSNPGTSRQGQQVGTAGPRTRTQVTQHSWSTPQTLGYEPESPGRAGRCRGPWEPGLICLGQLVDKTSPRTRTQVNQDRWSTPRAFGPRPESRTDGQPRSHTHAGPSRSGQRVYPTGRLNRLRVTRESWSTLWVGGPNHKLPGMLVNTAGPRNQARFAWDNWSTPLALVHGPGCPGKSG